MSKVCRYCGTPLKPRHTECPNCCRDNAIFIDTMGENAAAEPDLHKQSKHYEYGQKKDLDKVEKWGKIDNWEEQDLDHETYMALRAQKVHQETQAGKRKAIYTVGIIIFAVLVAVLFIIKSDSLFQSKQIDSMSMTESCLYFSEKDGVYYFAARNNDEPQLWHLSASTGKWSLKIDFEETPEASLPVGPFYKISPNDIVKRAPKYKDVDLDYFDLELTKEYIDYNTEKFELP